MDKVIEKKKGLYAGLTEYDLSYHASLEFLIGYCTHPELFQDIKNSLLQAYESHIKQSTLPSNQYSFVAMMFITPLYPVLTIRVQSSYRSLNRIPRMSLVKEIYLSLSEDGLITDILVEHPRVTRWNERVTKLTDKEKQDDSQSHHP